MKRYNFFRQLPYAVCLCVMALFAVSCSNETALEPISPVTPTTPGQQILASASTIKPVLRKWRNKNGFGGKSTKNISSSAGGYLGYMAHAIEVPKYAFSEQSKEFSITDVNSNWIQANYGPSGWFLLPVKVTMCYADADLKGINANNLTISWYDTVTGTWISVGGVVDKVNQTISVWVWHFTEYTISVR